MQDCLFWLADVCEKSKKLKISISWLFERETGGHLADNPWKFQRKRRKIEEINMLLVFSSVADSAAACARCRTCVGDAGLLAIGGARVRTLLALTFVLLLWCGYVYALLLRSYGILFMEIQDPYSKLKKKKNSSRASYSKIFQKNHHFCQFLNKILKKNLGDTNPSFKREIHFH